MSNFNERKVENPLLHGRWRR